MTFMFKKLITAAILLSCFIFPAGAATPTPPAMPRDYVTDLAGVVHDDAKVRLNALLRELEQKTTAQVLVLTVQSLDGESIEQFALTTKETWKLGQKGKDNGVLIVVAVNDRKYRLEIGYGLESVLPDSLVGTIGREYLVPYFKKGDYSSGIYSGTTAVASIIAENEGVQLAGRQPVGGRDSIRRQPLTFMQKVLFGLFILVAGVYCITHPRQCLLLLMVAQMGGGRGGWSGGGGGFGGGGFGGGGGGRGGGGGASGGW